jgi:hypothetical protein
VSPRQDKPVLAYAQRHPKTKAAVRREGDRVSFSFNPLPATAHRLIGEANSQVERFLIVHEGVIYYPGGCVREKYTLKLRHPWSMPGIVQLVAQPPYDPQRRRSIADEFDPPGMVTMLYGSVEDDFDWLVATLRQVRQVQLAARNRRQRRGTR